MNVGLVVDGRERAGVVLGGQGDARDACTFFPQHFLYFLPELHWHLEFGFGCFDLFMIYFAFPLPSLGSGGTTW